MTIIAEKTDTATKIEDWCREVRDLYREHARPIESFEDPRMMELLTRDIAEGTNPSFARMTYERDLRTYPDLIGRMYFVKCVPLPQCPIEVPEWALPATLDLMDWPNANIVFKSPEVTTQEASAWTEQMVSILVTDSETTHAGSVTWMDPDVAVSVCGQIIDFYGADTKVVKSAFAVALQALSVFEGANRQAPSAAVDASNTDLASSTEMRPCTFTGCVDDEHRWLRGEFNDSHQVQKVRGANGIYTIYGFNHEDGDGWHPSVSVFDAFEDGVTVESAQAFARDFESVQVACDKLNAAEGVSA